MNDISPLAWIAIIAIVLITAAVNIGMVLLLRQGPANLNKIKPPAARPENHTGKIVSVLRDPFAKERGQLDELAGMVRDLKEAQPPGKEQDE